MKIKTTNFLISLLLCFMFSAAQLIAQNNIIFVTDDLEEENMAFLENQGFNVTQFWKDPIAGVGQDTIDMLNAADLVILGRSGSSWAFASPSKEVWNAITAPVMLICQWKARSSRINWFNSENMVTLGTPDIIDAKISDPTDAMFTNADIAADSTMDWFEAPNHDFIKVDSVTNADVVATYSDDEAYILIARFDTDEEFYPGAGDTARGPRTYMGFGSGISGGKEFFPLSKNAKAVYLAEICNMMGIAIQEPVFGPSDYNIIFNTADAGLDVNRDSLHIQFLEDEGFRVKQVLYTELLSESDETIEMINHHDLAIIARSSYSTNFDAPDKYAWNKEVEIPLIITTAWAVRNSRINWFNSASCGRWEEADQLYDTVSIKIEDPSDPVFADAVINPADSMMEWSILPESFLRFDSAAWADNNWDILADSGDAVVFARIDPCVEFYTNAGAETEKAAGPRVLFGMGNDHIASVGANFFPLIDNARTVYLNEINRLLTEPYTVCTDYPADDATLSSLTVDVGTMTPAFDAAVTEYMVMVPQGTDSVLITAVANDANADTVTGTGYVKMGDGMASASVEVTAEDTYNSMTYNVTLQTEITIDGVMGEGEWDWVEAMPVEKQLNVNNIADENDYSLYFKMLWSDDALYLLIDVIDDIVYLGNTNVYMDDNIEIYFDMNNSKIEKWPRNLGWASRPWDQMDDNDMQLRIQPTEDAVLYESNLFGTTIPNPVVNGITFAHAETEGTGYVFEMMLDFDSLAIGYSGFVAQEGTEIGFDIDGSDNDGDPDARDELGWSADRQLIYTDAGLWGTLEFNADGTVTQILDEEAPSAPRNLAAEASGMNVTLSWDPSSDNIIVDEYHIYVEGVKIDSVPAEETDNEVTVDVTGHVPGGTYEVTVTGVDPSDNEGDADTTEVTVTGIEEAIVSYSIYPVPASDILIVENTDLIESIEVFDLVGQSVMNVTVKAKYIELKTSNLKPGVYVIKLHTAGEVYSEQLLIK